MYLYAAGETDPGRVRSLNEDSILLDPDLQLFAVADGMGGHAAGEVASAMAVEALRESVAGLPAGCASSARDLAAALGRAGRAIHRAAEERPERRGMGTTVAAALRIGPVLAVAHVGDSRVYRIRGGELERLTEDHSLVAEQVREGILTAEEADRSPKRNLLTRALGYRPEVEVDATELPLRAGDRFLLCTDGLTGLVRDGRILAVLEKARDPAAACRRLIRAANRAGGTDNVSAVVLEVRDDEPHRRPEGVPETRNGGDPC